MLDSQEFNSQEKDVPDLSSSSGLVFEESVPIDDAPSVYGALKCYFYTPKRGDIWGASCLLFNGTTGEAMENVFWVTRALVGAPVDVNMHWKALNKMIPQMGSYEKVLGDKLSGLMLEAFSSTTRVELFQNANTSDQLQTISSEIRNSFERATHCFLEFIMAFERMSKQDLANAGVLTNEKDSAKPEADKAEPEEKTFAGTLITCLPVIDPVHGTPVSELNPNDMVEVKIQGGVGASGMIHKYLTSTNQDAIFPVESIERSDAEKTYVYLKINEEVKGVITVTKDIRLRVLRTEKRRKTSVTINLDNVIFIGVLAAAALVIVFVVKFLLF